MAPNQSDTEYGQVAGHEGMSPREYMATRLSSLKPPMHPIPNPIKLVRMVSAEQWGFFLIAFFAWVRCEPECSVYWLLTMRADLGCL